MKRAVFLLGILFMVMCIGILPAVAGKPIGKGEGKDKDGDGYSKPQDCDDRDPAINPAATEILYNLIDENCNGMADDIIDADGDGYTSDIDCDDADASINPGAAEICGDAVDQDCSGADLDCSSDPDDIDDDGDGFTENQGDCNDSNPLINPAATEIPYNLIDENCNGMADDIIDVDGDGYTSEVDCDDTDTSINPGAAEICDDGIDQDCNGEDLVCPIDPNDVDNDGDGFTENQGDCNDSNPLINPDATEITDNGIDENCNGMADDTQTYSDNHFNNPNCLQCHTSEAKDVHASVHYQWQGDTPYMTNGGSPQGKFTDAVNSYCINIMGNWGGCSSCHVGKGAMPEPVATQAQLENIDCLKCHSEPGVLPTRVDCLTCHAKAGGGDAVKRGDLALATGSTSDRNYDVHMATTGADLQCRSCHTTQNHRIAGKGSDLRPTDLDVAVECSNCHTDTPHSSSTTNRHTARVACQTCHIPVYAKNAADTTASEATETHRTWLSSHATAPPFHPAADKANDLIPAYRFWNGYSDNYLLGDVAVMDMATGAYPTSRPEGAVSDSGSKLYPFKYKTAEQPMMIGTQQLIALDTSVYFMSADAATATASGLANMGFAESTPYEWVMTDTYQLLNHQVSPREQALQCSSCHLTTGRMDLQGGLGYAPSRPQSTCASACHSGSKAAEWQYGNWGEFTSRHDKHINEKGAECIDCHDFNR